MVDDDLLVMSLSSMLDATLPHETEITLQS